MNSSNNKRKSKRVSGAFIVTYKLPIPIRVGVRLGDTEFVAVAVDISEGGMGLDLGEQITISSLIRLTFNMSNTLAGLERFKYRKFNLAAEVRFSEPTANRGFRAGVLFTNISADEIEFIREYVKDNFLKEY